MRKLDAREAVRFCQISQQVTTHLELRFTSLASQANILPTLLYHLPDGC